MKYLILFLISLTLSAGTIYSGKVVGVHDGDTVTILDSDNNQHKVRLSHIDAPELSQPFGNQSKKQLSDKIFGKIVKIDVNTIDRYRREIATITYQDRFINLEMVTDGFAWHYKQYSKSEIVAEAEREAISNKKGLWADSEPVEPWNYRKIKKEK